MFLKASRKMLGSRRTSSPFLDLLGSGGLGDQPAQLQLHLARTPEWGKDLLLKLHARRVPDRTHPQGPIRLEVCFCAQALLHKGGTREPLWRQIVSLNLDFGKGEYEAGLENYLQGGELWGYEQKAGLAQPDHTETPSFPTHMHVLT